MKGIKIIIADDQILIAQSLKFVIESMAEDMEVIKLASTGREVVNLVEEEQPDIILMDIRMPDLNGIDATRIILEKHSDINIIMLTTFDDKELVEDAVDAGSVGYLLKDISTDELINAIKAVHTGTVIMSPTIAAKLYHHRKDNDKFNSPDYPEWFSYLTEKEIELLKLIKQGNSNQEISDKVLLAKQTVKNYLSVIYSKIGVESRRHAKKMIANLNL